jgi:peptide/nickel transport system substrate-binding protein
MNAAPHATAPGRRWVLTVAALTLCGALSACRPSTSAATGNSRIVIGTAIPRAGASTGVAGVATLFTLESPVGMSWEGRPAERVFERFEWLPDHLGLRLRVKPGITFHDGTPLTNVIAADIVRAADLDLVVSVESVGDDELVLRTSEPTGFLLSEMSVMDFARPGHPNVGTGPFKLESEGESFHLSAFDGYRLGRPAMDGVDILPYDTQRSAWTALMRGEINVLHDATRDAMDFVDAETQTDLRVFLRSFYDALVFNLRHPVLANPEVRKAITEAVDRREIIERALRNRGIEATDPIWPYHWARTADGPSYAHDPERARQRLDAAGLPVRASDGVAMPSRFTFTCVVVAEDQRLQRVALVLQRQLQQVGIDMRVTPLPASGLRPAIKAGSIDALLIENGAWRSSAPVYDSFYSSLMPFGYKSADAALDRFRRAIEDNEIRASIAEVQRAMYDDPPAVFIDWIQRARVVSRSIDVPVEEGRDILGSINRWRPASPQSARR